MCSVSRHDNTNWSGLIIYGTESEQMSFSTQLPRSPILRISRSTSFIAITMAALCMGLIGPASADNYSDLAALGYRWVIVDGPYACTTEQDVQRIVDHHTDEAELHMVENIRCDYLIQGAIVQVIKEDPANGMAEMRLEGVTRSLWTYTRFLSKNPVHDTYGAVETPENTTRVRPQRTHAESRRGKHPAQVGQSSG